MSEDRSNRDPLPPEIIEALLNALRPMAPADLAGLKARILERIARDAASPPGVTTIRIAEGEWLPLLPGVESKTLYDDGVTRTWLARMQAGASLPAHPHEDVEECLLVEGTVTLGDTALAPGDYQIAPAGTQHGVVHSPTGCTLLLRSASQRPARPRG